MIKPVLLVLTAGLLLTGCAPTVPSNGKATPTMTSTYPAPEKTRATTLELFEATRHLIGGTNWDLDGEDYGPCPLPDGSEGAEYTRQEGINTTLNATTMAKQIADLWESRGYLGVRTEPLRNGLGYSVDYGMDARRVYLHVSITDFSATIHMSGACVPGDSSALRNALVN